jgi:hypothetical protein
MHASFDKRHDIKILDHNNRGGNRLPEIKKLHLDNILKD